MKRKRERERGRRKTNDKKYKKKRVWFDNEIACVSVQWQVWINMFKIGGNT